MATVVAVTDDDAATADVKCDVETIPRVTDVLATIFVDRLKAVGPYIHVRLVWTTVRTVCADVTLVLVVTVAKLLKSALFSSSLDKGGTG
jgi:hypothetical protein